MGNTLINKDLITTGFMGGKVPESDLIKKVQEQMEEIMKTTRDLRDAQLIQVCEENDFIVNNTGLKLELLKVLPENTKIWVDKYVDPNCVFIIKRACLHPEFQPIHFDDFNKEENK